MKGALESLNNLQEKFAHNTDWTLFFQNVYTGNGICAYELASINEKDKQIYDEFCNLAFFDS